MARFTKPKSHQNQKGRKSRGQRTIILVVAAAIILVGVVLAIYLHHRSNNSHAGSGGTTIHTPQPVTNKATGNSQAAGSGDTSQKGSSSTPTTVDANQPLTKPTGTFVSNHKPGQNGSPLKESSVCLTTPGASCYISFTNGSVTKNLPAVTADGSGAAYWPEWVPSDIGLTAGSWTVTAVASLGQQTASTQDQLPLEIAQ